jgi:hypothetical protein
MAGNWGHFSMGMKDGNTAGRKLGFKTVAERGHSVGHPGHPVEAGQWYDVKVTCRGNEFCASVDGKNAFSPKTCDEAKKGAVGLWAIGKGTVRFKDIKVTSPEGTVLWQGLPDLDLSPQRSGVPDMSPDSPDDESDVAEEPSNSSDAVSASTKRSENGFDSGSTSNDRRFRIPFQR